MAKSSQWTTLYEKVISEGDAYVVKMQFIMNDSWRTFYQIRLYHKDDFDELKPTSTGICLNLEEFFSLFNATKGFQLWKGRGFTKENMVLPKMGDEQSRKNRRQLVLEEGKGTTMKIILKKIEDGKIKPKEIPLREDREQAVLKEFGIQWKETIKAMQFNNPSREEQVCLANKLMAFVLAFHIQREIGDKKNNSLKEIYKTPPIYDYLLVKSMFPNIPPWITPFVTDEITFKAQTWAYPESQVDGELYGIQQLVGNLLNHRYKDEIKTNDLNIDTAMSCDYN